MDPKELWHTFTSDEVFEKLKTSPDGLFFDEVKKRLLEFGLNSLEENKTSKLTIFFRQFNNFLVYILLAASCLSFFLKEYRDFFVIIGIIVINAIIAFWQEIKAESSLEALKKLTAIQNKVIREKKLQVIPSKELAIGDIVVLHEGEAITADIRLFDSRGLMVDESSLTGESSPILKQHDKLFSLDTPIFEQNNMVFAGTLVTKGSGYGIVCRTGSFTHFASIAKRAEEKAPDTPLTRSLNRFLKGFIFCIVTLFLSFILIGYLQNRELTELIYILLASLVSAVPEGLPIVLTLVMAIGALKLSKQGALVRYLPSVETMGSATVIATDKTGTVTSGSLEIAEIYSLNDSSLKRVAALCNDSSQGSGDPIDAALYRFVENIETLRKEHPREWEIPFDAATRFMATQNTIGDEKRVLVKGAYEAISQYSKQSSEDFSRILQEYLEKGYRTLCFAEGKGGSKKPEDWDLEIVGIIGFIDPPKAGAKEAVLAAKNAGIRAIMITGDHPTTAKTIAKEVGIYQEGDLCITGQDFLQMAKEELVASMHKATVFARIIPEHKYRVVKLLQEQKEIVSVTGDGVNDVPALRKANIGIAMGGGTEAAKSASEMVLTENHLHVIVDAIRNARVISSNMRKVIYYLMSTSFQELVLISLSIFSSFPIPLSAIQILWINIVTDGVQDKFFAFAKEEGDVMRQKPKDPDKLFFNKRLIFQILLFSLTMGLLTYLLYRYLFERYPFNTVTTVIFTSIVFAQWANGLQAQKEDEPFLKNFLWSFRINPLVYLGACLGLFLQMIAIYWAPEFFSSSPIPQELWKYPIAMFGISFALVEIRKWLFIAMKRFLLKSSQSQT